MGTLRCAVVGVGYLGKFHAEKYANHPEVDLVAICDIEQARSAELAEKLQTSAISNYRELVGKVDAVTIAVPTSYHYDIAKFFLEHNIHVLLEKPITTTVEQADDLIRIANENGLVLQVGHLERFNTVLIEAQKLLTRPGYIESHRLAMYNPRGTDVNVMLDLMIHDIDIIQYLIDSPIHEIRANGASVLSNETDIATARIQFKNACVANVVASRVSIKSERKMRIFQPDAYVFLDLQNKMISVHRKGEGEMFPGIPKIVKEEHTIEQGDALNSEVLAFVDSILNNKPAVVTGEDGKRALATAIRITHLVQTQFEIEAEAT